MPKGYGYDEPPKKSPAFKMKGWSGYQNSPMTKNVGGPTTEEGTEKSKKQRAYEMYEEHKGKKGFQEYMDKVFGGETKVVGSTTITTKPQ